MVTVRTRAHRTADPISTPCPGSRWDEGTEEPVLEWARIRGVRPPVADVS
jgi:hypothetical protein